MTNHFMESKSTDDMENYVSLQEMISSLREMVHNHFNGEQNWTIEWTDTFQPSYIILMLRRTQ